MYRSPQLSELQEQEMRVPQGSILSVTLFNIKINNIVKCLNLGIKDSPYVDDFLICCKSKYIRTIERQLQQCLNKINNWTIKNGFKFSKNETQCMHFCNLHKMHNDPGFKLDSTEIPIVEEHKFLGIIFDKKLTFKSDIKYLRSKCNKAIQLIRVIAHTDWGVDKKKTLLKLYRTLIQSKLDYDTFIYGSARKSYLKQLNTIHHQGLRLALGAYKTSPIESLYTEANESLLLIRRQKLALQYYIKLASCPSNPAHNVFYCPQNKTLFETKTNPIKPFSLWIENLITKIQIDKTQILKSTPSKPPPWLLKRPKISLNLTKYHKKNTHPTIFHEKFLRLKNNRPNHICIYTDSSKNENKVLCAAIRHNTKITKWLPSSTSIYSAEAKATDLALNIIAQTEFNIFSDSLSVLTFLKNPNLDNPLTVQWLNRLEILLKTKEI